MFKAAVKVVDLVMVPGVYGGTLMGEAQNRSLILWRLNVCCSGFISCLFMTWLFVSLAVDCWHPPGVSTCWRKFFWSISENSKKTIFDLKSQRPKSLLNLWRFGAIFWLKKAESLFLSHGCRILVDLRSNASSWIRISLLFSLSSFYSILAEFLSDIRLLLGGGGGEGRWYFRICWLIGPMILSINRSWASMIHLSYTSIGYIYGRERSLPRCCHCRRLLALQVSCSSSSI